MFFKILGSTLQAHGMNVFQDFGLKLATTWRKSFSRFRAQPCHVLSCLVMSCLVMSCLDLSCLVMSCHVLSCLVVSCQVLRFVHGIMDALNVNAEKDLFQLLCSWLVPLCPRLRLM